jgi:cell division protein FtsN
VRRRILAPRRLIVPVLHSLEHSMRRIALFSALLLVLAATHGEAQTGAPASANDSLFRRARRMVADGNGVAGRALVDSLLKQAPEGSAAFGDALYWRGALAQTAADAEHDYRRVIVEYPLSIYADDALLAIAELEQARGDRDGALQHLQRFVREHPVSSARGVAALAAARLAFEERDTRTGCAMISEARVSASQTDVELRNQIDYFGNRCTATEAAAVAQSTTAPAQPAAGRDSIRSVPAPTAGKPTTTVAGKGGAARPAATGKPVAKAPGKAGAKTPEKVSGETAVAEKAVAKVPDAVVEAPAEKTAPPKIIEKAADKPVEKPATKASAPPAVASMPAPKPRGIYTIQLAAYGTRPDAERLVAKLATRGVKARVSGTEKPFRVRLDFYPTRQAALDEVAALRAKSIIGFVTTEEPSAAGAQAP